ncbi:MAG: hypothetical protein UV05_C0005G0008 [candidate division CPR1 bacterium GW2011_GWA2_42_17]|uniref:Uncharacterized protein n=1 Tax=candidate division CPR1 bacterium GW2011_GWA2_42_17 TaxID=1618341 RepID=A0A0G1BDQ6_9BACT|nr:MAG: hypothetical protein UV05_C0005G0008 [candidate division CPR1 bacterium GW2011_GWA2_42_17]
MISSIALAPFASSLLPELNEGAASKFGKTWQAINELRQSLAYEAPSHLLLIAPQTQRHNYPCGLAQNETYMVGLQKLGGAELPEKIKGDLAAAHRLKEKLESLNMLSLETRELSLLENIGLHLFWPTVKKMRLMPLVIRPTAGAKLYTWGHLVGNALADLAEKIAVLGLIELSFPAGYMLKNLAAKCDQKIIEALKTNEPKKIIRSLTLEYGAVKDGSREVVLFMMGLTQNLPGRWEILSNETIAGQRTITARWLWRN